MYAHWNSCLYFTQEENLSDKPFASLPKVEAYAEMSVSPIFYLTLQSLGQFTFSCFICMHVYSWEQNVDLIIVPPGNNNVTKSVMEVSYA